jgi:hypothetical protein
MDMFSTRTMLGMITEADKNAKTFLRDRYFSNTRNFDTTKIDIDIVGSNGRKVAPFVNPKVGGIVLEREGYQTNSYEAPEMSPMRITTAEDMLKRSPGETIYGAKSPTERAAEQLGRDLSDLDDIITRREEVMCAEALFTGKITIKGEGYDEVVNYWPTNPAEQPKTTLTTLWTAGDADIQKDLRTIRRGVIQKCGITPTEIICGTDALEALLAKLTVKEQLDMRRVDMGFITPSLLPNGVTYWGYLKDSGLDIYSYDEWYLNDEGVETPMVPTDLVLLTSQGVKTTMAYGCVSLAGDDNVNFYMGSRIPDSWVQRANPSGRVVQIKSRPLPIIHQIQGFHVIKAV